ncbi:helix-turn-helix domain-containing protein [Thiotrichales bacterium 19S9-12]|nr:helix-turn-helix domain-containing protein [Thiotrichales bacterium 19S9-11]MCF6812508.1 helix-turn-helix domain-containing protein [Thiotrichales bacterium 19S9-12]
MLVHSPHDLSMLIKNQRKKLNLTQQAIGDLVGLKQKTISAIEKNPENIKLSTLFRVLTALNAEIKIVAKDASLKTNDNWNDEW